MSLVEVPERKAEREKRQEVEIPQRERSAEIGKPNQEGGAEAEPDRQAVDLLPPKGPRIAPRHLPGDLGAGPGLRDDAGRVLNESRRDLADLVDRGPDLDRPVRELRAVGRLGRAGLRRVMGQPVCDLWGARAGG